MASVHGALGSRGRSAGARRAAAIGGPTLPPVLALFVAVDGNSRPQALLAGAVYAAWIALFVGAIAAIVEKLRS